MKLMEISDMINALNLLRILIFFLTPTFAVLLTIYTIGAIKRRMGRKGKHKTKKLPSDRRIYKALSKVPSEPKDKSKYLSLGLEFDERGFVKK